MKFGQNSNLIAEESSPSFVAVALPGFLARSVLTARVTNALVAEGTGPTIFAPKKKRFLFHKFFKDGLLWFKQVHFWTETQNKKSQN
jgi:hypothetical protein